MHLQSLLAILVTFFCSIQLHSSCTFEFFVAETEANKITEIVTTVAHSRMFSLWGKESHLKQLGAEVDKKVDFLNFWAFILSSPRLVSDMKIIQGSSLKYNSFISGGREAILASYNKDKECFLNTSSGFATYLKVDPEKTKALLKEGLDNFQNNKLALKPFFNYLIGEKSKSN
jgi:hypothetical protein